MAGLRFRSLGAVLLAIVCAAVLGVTSTLPSAFVFGVRTLLAEVALLADEGWIMGGTGNPDPAFGAYMSQVQSRYLPTSPLFTNQPTFPASYHPFNPLITPEQFCPITCVPSQPNLNFGDSVNQGVIDLHNAITPQLIAGDNVAVFGYSQSATVTTQEMTNLINNPPGGHLYDPSNLHVVLVGDPNNPIGGILDRFQFPDGIKAFSLDPAPQHLPFLNVPLSMDPTPTSPFPTDIYTGEYDGWANFPRDPLNVPADINAIAGILTVHPDYPTLDNLGDAINVGTIGDANFYMIPEQLPILWPMYQVPYAGPVVADAIAPELKMIIDWGYGNPGDPDAGIVNNLIDPIGAAGPWQITATGQLAADSGIAGFFPKMDPLQILAGLQNAEVNSIVNPINDILGYVGQQPIPQSVIDALQMISGYNLINDVDQFLLTGWTDLATTLNIQDFLGPDVIFDGAPLIDGTPVIALVGGVFDVFNFFGA